MTDESEKTGTDLLRAVAHRRVKALNYAGLAKDIGIAAEDFFDFAQGRKDLSAETKCRLARVLMQSTEYYPEQDLLGPAQQPEPKLYGIPPAPYQPKPLNLRSNPIPGPQPVNPQPAVKTKRPGWLGGWT